MFLDARGFGRESGNDEPEPPTANRLQRLPGPKNRDRPLQIHKQGGRSKPAEVLAQGRL